MSDDNKAYQEYNSAFNGMITSLSKELDISEACAVDVWYLRRRSRWSQELEDRLIDLWDKGTPPNIMEFN